MARKWAEEAFDRGSNGSDRAVIAILLTELSEEEEVRPMNFWEEAEAWEREGGRPFLSSFWRERFPKPAAPTSVPASSGAQQGSACSGAAAESAAAVAVGDGGSGGHLDPADSAATQGTGTGQGSVAAEPTAAGVSDWGVSDWDGSAAAFGSPVISAARVMPGSVMRPSRRRAIKAHASYNKADVEAEMTAFEDSQLMRGLVEEERVEASYAGPPSAELFKDWQLGRVDTALLPCIQMQAVPPSYNAFLTNKNSKNLRLGDIAQTLVRGTVVLTGMATAMVHFLNGNNSRRHIWVRHAGCMPKGHEEKAPLSYAFQCGSSKRVWVALDGSTLFEALSCPDLQKAVEAGQGIGLSGPALAAVQRVFPAAELGPNLRVKLDESDPAPLSTYQALQARQLAYLGPLVEAAVGQELLNKEKRSLDIDALRKLLVGTYEEHNHVLDTLRSVHSAVKGWGQAFSYSLDGQTWGDGKKLLQDSMAKLKRESKGRPKI